MSYLQHWVIAHKPIRNLHLGKQMHGENWQEQPKISLIVYKREFYQAYFWPVMSCYYLLHTAQSTEGQPGKLKSLSLDMFAKEAEISPFALYLGFIHFLFD